MLKVPKVGYGIQSYLYQEYVTVSHEMVRTSKPELLELGLYRDLKPTQFRVVDELKGIVLYRDDSGYLLCWIDKDFFQH